MQTDKNPDNKLANSEQLTQHPSYELFGALITDPNSLFQQCFTKLSNGALYQSSQEYDLLLETIRQQSERSLVENSGEIYDPNNPIISLEAQDSRRAFLFGAIDYFIDAQTKINSVEDKNNLDLLSQLTEDCFFSNSPNFADYIGSFSNIIDTLIRADKSPFLKRLRWELTEQIMQGINFSKDPRSDINLFTDMISSADPQNKLKYIRILNRVSTNAINAGYGDRASKIIVEIFKELENDESAIVSLMSLRFRERIQKVLTKVESVTSPESKINLIEKYGLTPQVALPERFKDNYSVALVSKEFIGLRNQSGDIDYIAPTTTKLKSDLNEKDIAPNHSLNLPNKWSSDNLKNDVVNYHVKQVASEESSQLHLSTEDARTYLQNLNYSKQKIDFIPHSFKQAYVDLLGDDLDEQYELLREMHHPAVRTIIDEALCCKLTDLSIEAQVHLSNFLFTQTKDKFKQITEISKKIQQDGVVNLADFYEEFLALEFGADYGNSLLTIAEHAKPKELADILKLTAGFRKKSQQFSKWFEGFDPSFAQSVRLAMNERLTDMLVMLEITSLQTNTVVNVTPGDEPDPRFDFSIESLPEAIDLMKQLDKSMTIMLDVIPNSENTHRVNEDTQQFSLVRFNSPFGTALIYIRKEGARRYDKQYEFGTSEGVEASISFIVNPLSPGHLRSDKDENGVSIRFDREGRTIEEDPSSESRDPTRQDGLISLDISSILGVPTSIGTKIGRFIASGNVIRAQRLGRKKSLHHNTSYFDQKLYGSAEGFAKLAHWIELQAISQMSIQN